MDKVNKSCSTRLVEGDGTLNVTGLKRFIEDVKLAEYGVSYAVVSIMGPQNSGKSTLLNELFGTNFELMDDQAGISQTTKGIWMAKCPDINPCTIILDLEGTDGSERGEAMLQMKLFTQRKITLLFVLRDKSKTPLDKIQCKLLNDVNKIWDSVPRSETAKKPELSELFDVKLNGLSNCDLPKFEEEVRCLRERIINSIAPGGGDDMRGVVPASGFSLNVQKLWAAIKENKYLDLPANREKAARSRLEPGFGKRLDLLIQKCLIDYDKRTAYLEEGVRFEKQKQLEEKMQLHLSSKLMSAERDCTKSSIEEFDGECTDIMGQANSDSAIYKAKNKLSCDMDSHITQVRLVKLSELTREYESKISKALLEPVKDGLNGWGDHTWPKIREVLQNVTETNVKEFHDALSAFGIDEKTKVKMHSGLLDFAKQEIESTARVETRPDRVLQCMLLMYMRSFYGQEGVLQAVSMGEDITELIKTSNHECLKLLSSNAAIRLEDDDYNNIWNTLEWALLNYGDRNALNSETWQQVPEARTLISPAMCTFLWTQFRTQTAVVILKKETAKEKIWSFNTFVQMISMTAKLILGIPWF